MPPKDEEENTISNNKEIQKKINELKKEELRIVTTLSDSYQEIKDIQEKLNTATDENKKNLEEELKKQKDIYESSKKELELSKEKEKILKANLEIIEETAEEEENTFSWIIEQNKALLKQQKYDENRIANQQKIWNFTRNSAETAKEALKNQRQWMSTVNSIDVEQLNPKVARKTMVDMERSATALSVRAGQGREGVVNLTTAFTDLQKITGESSKNAKEIIETLSKTGYIGNIQEAATGVSLFNRATGESADSTVALMNSLTKVGKFSNEQAVNALTNIAKVQQKNGMTAQGMSTLTNSIKTTTDNMRAFGQTNETIQKMVISTANLVSGMEKVGVAASDATKFIEGLTDPTKIENNIGLYAQLGMSISDALSGNLDIDQVGEGLKEFGQKVKEMGPIAGAEYAKAFGVTYNMAIKAADYEAPEVEAEEQSIDKNLKALEDMKQATLDASANMQESFNKLAGTMQGLNGNLLRGMHTIDFILLKMPDTITRSLTEAMTKAEESTDNYLESYIDATLSQITAHGEELLNENAGSLDSAIADFEKSKEAVEAARKQLEEYNQLESSRNWSASDSDYFDSMKAAQEEIIKAKPDDSSLQKYGEYKLAMEKETEAALEQLEGVLDKFPGEVGQEYKDYISELKETARKNADELEDALKKGGDDLEKSLKNGGNSVEADLKNGSRNLQNSVNNSMNSGATKIRGAGRTAGNSMGSSTRNASRAGANDMYNAIRKGGNQAASRLESATKKGGMKGGGGSWVSMLITAVVSLVPTILNAIPGVKKFFSNNQSGFWGVIGKVLGIETELADSVKENTEALGENSAALDGRQAPEQIFMLSNGHSVVKAGNTEPTSTPKSGTTTSSTVINKENNSSTNSTSNSSSSTNSTTNNYTTTKVQVQQTEVVNELRKISDQLVESNNSLSKIKDQNGTVNLKIVDNYNNIITDTKAEKMEGVDLNDDMINTL